jgi:hypothetical protein
VLVMLPTPATSSCTAARDCQASTPARATARAPSRHRRLRRAQRPDLSGARPAPGSLLLLPARAKPDGHRTVRAAAARAAHSAC